MRLLTFGIVTAVVATGACNRAEPVASNFVTPASASAGATPVATAGRTDPAPAPRPSEWREITLPAGTRLPIILETTVGSDTSRVEEPVQARIARPVNLHGETVLAQGSRVTGVVTDATRSGKVKGRAHLAVRFDTLVPQGPNAADERYKIHTASVGRTAAGTKKKDALEIGAPAAGGALVGALLGGKKGALVGTAVGGGAGTAVVLSTRGKEVRLARGAALTLQLSEPLTIRVRTHG
jgi:hypothetical protein